MSELIFTLSVVLVKLPLIHFNPKARAVKWEGRGEVAFPVWFSPAPLPWLWS